ncbi:MAG: histidinol-phosphatase [Melioribacteraceae bacterium]
MISKKEIDEFKNFSKILTNASGKNIRKYFRKDLSVEIKSDRTEVTIADKTTEELLRKMIEKEYPDHGILGEEFGQTNKDAEYQWVLDPIDGTISFLCGTVTFGTLISVVKNGEPIVGVFHQPILDELLIGDNTKTTLNDSKVKVKDITNLEDAILLTTDHLAFEEYQNLEKFEQLMRKVKLYRQWGDCYGYYLLTSGFAHIMIDPIMSFWDTMALIPIVKGAGGVITDYQGKDAVKGESIIAASTGIHSEVIKMLKIK